MQFISPPSHLSKEAIGDISVLMMGSDDAGWPQMNAYTLTDRLQLLGIDDGVTAPEIIAFTIRSAIPVADTIRGVYEAAARDLPLLVAVESNTRARKAHKQSPERKTQEIERLKRIIGGRTSAVIIDQFVVAGYSITYASDLLTEAGSFEPALIKGRWYDDIGRTKISERRLTSRLAKQMNSIGHECFTRYKQSQLV